MALQKPTPGDVIDLTGTKLDTAVVSAIIDDAALIAEDCLSSLTGDRQKAALKWLSAHLVASTSDTGAAPMTSKKLGDASKGWTRAQVGDGVSGTTYGQQAIAIAPCLGRLGRPRASVGVV